MDAAKSAEQQLVKTVATASHEVAAGEVDSVETPARYLGYLARVRPILQPFSRYLAYTSDVGEAARPIVSARLVQGAYGVSWAYLIGDVGYEGYKAWLRAMEYCPERQAEVVGLGVAKRAIFQSTASMLFPALTIHSIVRYSSILLKRSSVKNAFTRQWGPSILGLGFIPALPFIFDEPVEHVVEKAFDMLEEKLYKDQPNVRRAMKSVEHGLKEE